MKENKKINLILSSSNDMLNMTLSSIENIKKSCCLVVSKKIKGKNLAFLKQINEDIIFEEDISKKNNLLNEIYKLFKKKKVISYIMWSEDNYLDQGFKEQRFFNNRDIEVKSFINVYDFINSMNSNNLFLTDREKNSSVTFLIYKSGMKIFEILVKGHFGKMVIKFKNSQHKPLINLIENLKKYKKFFFYFIFNNKFTNIVSFDVKNLERSLKNNKSVYLIIEDNETI